MQEKMLKDFCAEKIIQTIFLSYFSNLDKKEALLAITGTSSNSLQIIEAYKNLRSLATINKQIYSHYNNTSFIKTLVKKIVDHYGIIFTENEENIFAGILDETNQRLKKFLSILVSYDLRKAFYYSKSYIQNICFEMTSLINEIQLANPVLNLLYATSSIFINPVSLNIKDMLTASSEMHCLNSLFILQSLNPFFIANKETYYLQKNYLTSLDSPQNTQYYYDDLKKTLGNYKINIPDLDKIDGKRSINFYRLYKLCFSWLMFLGLDSKGINRLLNVTNQTIVPISEKKLTLLLQSSHPEKFLKDILQQNPELLYSCSIRLLQLYSSNIGLELYSNTSKKYNSIQNTLDMDKKHKGTYDPANLIIMYRRMPSLLKKFSVSTALDRSLVVNLLSHPSVNLQKWNHTNLYNFLINTSQGIGFDQLLEISKLPYLLTFYNYRDPILQFLTKPEFQILSTSTNGNLLFSKLGGKIFEISSITSRTMPKIASRYNSDSLLSFLTNLPEELLTWIIGKFSNNFVGMVEFLEKNVSFKKLVESGSQKSLMTYIPNVEQLLNLDTLYFTSTSTVLDFLTTTVYLQNIKYTFKGLLELLNAYKSKLLSVVRLYPELLNFDNTRLLKLQSHQTNFGNKSLSVLMMLGNANSRLLGRILILDADLIIKLADQNILQILIACLHLPEPSIYENAIILFNSLEILHCSKFDEKQSVLEFILETRMKHALIPILNFLSSDAEDKSIILNSEFLKAIEQCDPTHPIILEKSVDTWHKLFVMRAENYQNTNLFIYLTHPCNTFYWKKIVESLLFANPSSITANEIIDHLENHPSKTSFFGSNNLFITSASPQQSFINANTETNTSKKRLHNSPPQAFFKRPKNSEDEGFFNANNFNTESDFNDQNEKSYNKLISKLNVLYSANLSCQDKIKKLKEIKNEVNDIKISLSTETDTPQMENSMGFI